MESNNWNNHIVLDYKIIIIIIVFKFCKVEHVEAYSFGFIS
jgi:hypothetical protein